MKKLLSGLILCIVAFSVNAQHTVENTERNTPPTIRTASGMVQGVTEGDASIFKGIPFAAPPVGGYRWRPPQPVTPWEGIHEAKEFGPNGAQGGWGAAPGTIQEGSSEDCLYLNLWKPADALYPVSAETIGVNFACKHGIEGTDAAALARLRALGVEEIVDGGQETDGRRSTNLFRPDSRW
jgi:hypothetical protein